MDVGARVETDSDGCGNDRAAGAGARKIGVTGSGAFVVGNAMIGGIRDRVSTTGDGALLAMLLFASAFDTGCVDCLETGFSHVLGAA